MSPKGLALLRWLTVFALLVAVLAGTAPVADAADLVVHEQSAAPSFPNEITFTLRATLPSPPERVEIRYRPVNSPVTRVARPGMPATAAPSEIDIVHSIDMTTRYLPPGIDIIYRWHFELSDGTVIQTPERTFHYIDGRHDWRRLSQHPVSLSYSGDERTGAEALAIALRTVERFEEAFDIQMADEIRVVVYGNPQDFSAALPPHSAEWIGGFADPTLRLIVTGVRPGADGELRRIISHEVIHIMVDLATANPFNRPPAWLDEGLATYYQEVPDTRFPAILRQAVEDGALYPIRALNASFPDDPDGALLAYAQSESIARYIIEQHGADRMARLLRAYRDGVSHDEALQRSLGMTLDDLDREWKTWLGYPGDREPAAPGTLRERPDSGEISRFIARWGGILPLALAALACAGLGTLLIARLVGAREEPS